MDFFEYRKSLTEAKKFGRFSVHVIDPKNKSHLDLVGVKTERELRGRKKLTDYNLGDSQYELDPSNDLPPIFVNQTKTGLVLSMPESDFQHIFVEKFKINNRNAEDLFAWYMEGDFV